MNEQLIQLSIPNELNNTFFFSTHEITVEFTQQPSSLTSNFLYEMLYYNGISSYKPWQDPMKAIPMLLDDWKKEKPSIEELFKMRNTTGILPKMKKGTGLFIQLLFWSNERPVVLKDILSFDDIPYKPVNVGDRLAFILARPGLFPSYRLLSQLMVEQEKLFVKKYLKEKTLNTGVPFKGKARSGLNKR